MKFFNLHLYVHLKMGATIDKIYLLKYFSYICLDLLLFFILFFRQNNVIVSFLGQHLS